MTTTSPTDTNSLSFLNLGMQNYFKIETVIKLSSFIGACVLLSKVPFLGLLKGSCYLGASVAVGVLGYRNPEVFKDLVNSSIFFLKSTLNKSAQQQTISI
jgi:hypothetical protein